MIRAVLLLLAAGAILAGGEAPSRDPLPRIAPAVPDAAPPPAPTADEELRRRLEDRLRRLDADISQRVRAGGRPMAIALQDPRLDRPRRERERAARDLAEALAESAASARRPADILDGADPRRHLVQMPPIAAGNRLQIAECYRELVAAAAADGSADAAIAADLAAGKEALAAADAAALAPGELVRAAYLDLWFLAEEARLAQRQQAPDYARRRQLAEAARQTFLGRHPDSDLAPAAAALLAGLP
jgi:hypothetical protein